MKKTVADYDVKLRDSANSGSLDIFTVHNIANFITIHNNPETIKKLLQNAAYSDVSTLSLAQATGILQVYVELVNLNSAYAQLLLPALDGCIERITESCSFDNNVLTISENDTFLSVIQAVETGVAVMRYGIVSGNETLQKAGYVLVNSYLTENSSYDLRTLANLYPVIAYDNWYYPHFKRIKTRDNNGVWAWTCAKDITYDKDSEGSINLTVDFPEGLTHYIIVKGIPSFSSIYIYNIVPFAPTTGTRHGHQERHQERQHHRQPAHPPPRIRNAGHQERQHPPKMALFAARPELSAAAVKASEARRKPEKTAKARIRPGQIYIITRSAINKTLEAVSGAYLARAEYQSILLYCSM